MIFSCQRLEVVPRRFRLGCGEDWVLVHGRFWLCESEIFERILIRGFVVEAVSVELGHRNFVLAFVDADRLVSDFRHLVGGEGHLVRGIGSEGERVDWILGMFLVEHIGIAVLPVGVVHRVTALEVHGALT